MRKAKKKKNADPSSDLKHLLIILSWLVEICTKLKLLTMTLKMASHGPAPVI